MQVFEMVQILPWVDALDDSAETKTVPVPVYAIVSNFLTMRYKNRDGDGFFPNAMTRVKINERVSADG
jgi:hypothetical protein